MFATLLFKILRLLQLKYFFNVQLNFNEFHTASTNTINIIFGNLKYKGLYASLFDGIPMYITLTLLFYMNASQITHDDTTLSLVYIAVFWAWIGPALIWRHENTVSEEMLQSLRHVVPDSNDLTTLEKIIYYNVTSRWSGILFISTWALYVLWVVATSSEFLLGFGVHAYDDVWWYLILLGVVIFAYYTGIVGLLVLRVLYFIYRFSRVPIKIDPYHEDQTGGLGFIGNFQAQASLMCSSALLFVPLFLKLNATMFQQHDYKALILVLSYSAGILITFALSIYFIHRKIVIEKNSVTGPIRTEVTKYLGTVLSTHSASDAVDYQWRRGLLNDLQDVRDWPFNLRNIVQATVPPVTAIAYAFLKFWPAPIFIW